MGIKTVHRNHLLPCSFLPIQEVQRVSSPEVSDESSTDVDERTGNTSSDSSRKWKQIHDAPNGRRYHGAAANVRPVGRLGLHPGSINCDWCCYVFAIMIKYSDSINLTCVDLYWKDTQLLTFTIEYLNTN